MSDYREESEKYKVQRREPAPDNIKVLSKRKKRPKPFVVMYKWREKWHVRYRCATLEDAIRLRDKCSREFHIKEVKIVNEEENLVFS